MKFILHIIAILVVVLTLCICAIKPDMHKNIVIYNSDYMIKPEEIILTEKIDIPIMEVPVTPKEKTFKSEKKIDTVQKTAKVKTNKIIQKTTPIKTQKTIAKPETKIVNATKATKTEPKVQTQSQSTSQTQTTKPPVKEIRQESAITPVINQETLTPKEEEIAWNIWRSNLQNKIMQDVYMPPIPEGTVFKFSFNVDKYGRISNVQTYSSTSSYTPYAIQYIAPVIRSYQGKDILNFPKGSSRVTTTVTGGWKISVNEKYSTPQDYNDIEKVLK